MKRYDILPFINRGGHADAKMIDSADGEWVKFEDIKTLRAALKDFLFGED